MGEAAAVAGTIGFGRTFADHMVVAKFTEGSGWDAPGVVPFADLALSPAAMVFHYGQAVFEGLKVYRQPDGGIALFRSDRNAHRFDLSARRLAMPELPDGVFIAACRQTADANRDAVPWAAGESLYLRPTMIATEGHLGVRPASEYLYFVIASPAGAYFPNGVTPIRLWVADDAVRAAPGGIGAAKCGGNYAASLEAKKHASANGCDEVLWLDAIERRYIEELSGMNVVVVSEEGGRPCVVSTEPSGTILDGVTRRSLLELAQHLGFEVSNRAVGIDELCAGAFTEAFACGTGAVVVPMGSVVHRGEEFRIGDGTEGPVTRQLREELVGLQQGTRPDPFRWLEPV